MCSNRSSIRSPPPGCRQPRSRRRSAACSDPQANLKVLLAEVRGVSAATAEVLLDQGRLAFDYLVVATGAQARLLRPGRLGRRRSRAQADRGRDGDPPPPAHRLRASRERGRRERARPMVDLRDRRRRPDRRRARRRHRRTGAKRTEAGLQKHRPGGRAGHPGAIRGPPPPDLPCIALGGRACRTAAS